MLRNDVLPKVEMLFDDNDAVSEKYLQLIPLILKKILPPDFFTGSDDDRQRFMELLPLFTHSGFREPPFNLSFFSLIRYRPNAFKFFFEMISRWLVPGKRLNVIILYAIDFRMPELGSDVYTLCEIMIKVESPADSEELQRNLPIVESETKLGVDSAYYARKILEIKGLKADDKTAMIQESIAHLIRRMPQDFDNDVFKEMQYILVKCRDGFKSSRESRHISRIISVHFFFRKGIRESVLHSPGKRHILLKLTKVRLHLPKGTKNVLGIIVGLNYLKDNERFEERHILKAVRACIPNATTIEHSYFENARGSENIGLLYLEIEKSDNSEFTSEDICKLRTHLPSDLKDRVEYLIHPIFMPRNEEEVMRNILSLSGQIKFLRDIPQIILTFDEQTHSHLFFTVIFLRVLKADDQPIQKLFLQSGTSLEYLHDRIKTVGYIRKKYPKEATVFRVKLSKERFLRGDHSIDLYRARRFVVEELNRIMGDVRDYNGGMISKQNELLSQVGGLLAGSGKHHDLLLENLFYSLTPSIMRNVLEPEPLKSLFLMLLEVAERKPGENGFELLKVKIEGDYLLAMIQSDAANLKEKIGRTLSRLSIPSTDLATAFLTAYERPCLGYVYRSDSEQKRNLFKSILEQVL